jgi:hypothetical protein
MNASFEEKSVWIMLLSMLAAFGLYFFVAAKMLLSGITVVAPFIPLLAVAIVLLVLVVTAGHAVVAIGSRPEGRDERDRLISWRAENNSSWVLGVGVIAAIAGLAISLEPAWIANGLLMAMYISTLVKQALQLYYYRRGV